MIDNGAFQRFRAAFRGALLRPPEEGYDEARGVWNGAIDRKPALIARCAGSDDVVAAVRFAREQDLLVSVRLGHERSTKLAHSRIGRVAYALLNRRTGDYIYKVSTATNMRQSVRLASRTISGNASKLWRQLLHVTVLMPAPKGS